MSDRPKRLPWLFQLAAISTAVFVMTVFAMIATLFGDAEAPVNQWFDRHAGQLLLGEVLAIALFGVLAMLFDRS